MSWRPVLQVRRGLRSIALAGLGAALLSGCAAIERPPLGPQALDAHATAARAEQRALTAKLIDGLARRAAIRGDRTLDILLLSGGGQHGAYGVGFLRGWRARTTGSMPSFDLVSGVSTGALQAPFALLGTDAALERLAALYDRADGSAPRPDWWHWLRRTGGVVDVHRYRRVIERVVDEPLARGLRTEFAAARQLVIATTDLDLGIGRLWDAEAALASTTSVHRLHELLLASTAIAGIFPPVLIDGHVHADGGVAANIAPVLGYADYGALRAGLSAQGIETPVTVRLWVVLNLWTHPQPVAMDPADRHALRERGNLLTFWLEQPQLLQGLENLARAVNAGVPGLELEVRLTSIPAEVVATPAAAALFDADWMDYLARVGFERAQGTSPWDAVASAYERPPRATERR